MGRGTVQLEESEAEGYFIIVGLYWTTFLTDFPNSFN